MKRIADSVTFRLLTIAAFFVVLVIHPELQLSSVRADSSLAPGAPSIKSEAQVKSEAARYDAAIREIAGIANLKLAEPEESKKAQAILDKQIPNLRLIRSKLVALGLSDSSFVSAVKGKAPDKKSADQFAQELVKDNNAILKLPGSPSVADRIRSAFAADTAKLENIAELLKRAGAEIRAKARTHHVVTARARSVASDSPRLGMLASTEAGNHLSPAKDLDNQTVTLIVIAVAVIAFPPLGVALFGVASVAGGVLLAASGVLTSAMIILLGADLLSGQNKTDECLDKAKAKHRSCLSDANNLLFPLNIAAADACDAEALIETAACMLTGGLL